MFTGSHVWILGPLLALGLKLSVREGHLKKKKDDRWHTPHDFDNSSWPPFSILMPMIDADSDTEN